MVEEIIQVRNQSTKIVLKELFLKTFLICCFVVFHHPDGLPDVSYLRIRSMKRVER
jgi:hypothetical protein